MLNKFEAKIAACGAIADLFGVDYFTQDFYAQRKEPLHKLYHSQMHGIRFLR